MDPRQYQQQKDAHAIQQAIEEEKKNKKKRRAEQDVKELEEEVRAPQPQPQPQKQPQPQPVIQFVGFTNEQRDMVKKSHEIAKRMFECAKECIDEARNPEQQKLYNKWKVGPRIKEIIVECEKEFTNTHTYIDGPDDRKDDKHKVAYVFEEDCGKKQHQIHLYTKFFQQPSEITALTLVHEMTHDNSNTDDVKNMDTITVSDYVNETFGEDIEHTQAFVSHMMREYPNEMKEALNSQEVAKACTDLDSREGGDSNEASTLLDKYKNVTPETAESFWSTLTDDEIETSIELNEVVLCTHISMDKACLLEISPEKVANDAECIARFAYDCYKYKQGK